MSIRAIRAMLQPKLPGGKARSSLLRTRFLCLSALGLVLVVSFLFTATGRAAHPGPELGVSCEGRRVFVYDLDPLFNAGIARNCSDIRKNIDLCAYMENGGMGRAFQYEPGRFPDGVWHNAWQFSLELYFHERMRRYPCAAASEADADAFFVPFYAGMDLLNHTSHPTLKIHKAEVYMELLDWLRRQHSFLRNGGSDHFIALGRIALDFRRPDDDSWGSQMLGQPDFQNMVKLTPERDGSAPLHADNEIAVPYPSYYHPRRRSDIEALAEWAQRDAQRSVLVSIAGSRRRAGQGGAKEKLMADCESDARCTVLVCTGHDGVNQTDLSTRAFSFLPIAGHTVHESCSFPTILLDVFHRSVFCLQPPGATPTRRAFVDALLAGCIPVLFKRSSAWSQYAPFLPEDGAAYSLLIPLADVRRSNVVHLLAAVPPRQIKAMRAAIARLLPRILYAHVDRRYSHHEKDATQAVLEGADAFDIALNEVFSLVRTNVPL